jgi:hypothetical protein
MFKQTLVSGLLVLTLACAPALAQSDSVPPPPGNTEQGPPPGADQGPPPGGPNESMVPSERMGPPPMGGMSRRAANRALIASCRSRASAHGLVGHERRHAVLACVRAQRPHLAARMVCRQKGHRMGLRFRTEQMHMFVRKCLGRAV